MITIDDVNNSFSNKTNLMDLIAKKDEIDNELDSRLGKIFDQYRYVKFIEQASKDYPAERIASHYHYDRFDVCGSDIRLYGNDSYHEFISIEMPYSIIDDPEAIQKHFENEIAKAAEKKKIYLQNVRAEKERQFEQLRKELGK
jgi:nuclear transport factor 2 (NTF2) superfamily protein